MSQLPNNGYVDPAAGGGFAADGGQLPTASPAGPPAEAPPAAVPVESPAPAPVPVSSPPGVQPGGFGGQVGAAGFTPAAPPAKGGVLSKIGKGTMLLFAALVLGVITVAIVSQQSGPRPVEANQQVYDDMNKAIAEHKADPRASQKRAKDLFKDTEAIEKAFYGFAQRTQVPTDDLKQNPFVHRMKANPDQDQAAMAASQREKDRLAALARKKQEEQRRRIEAALKKLNVQTILYSDEDPMVLISNQVYHTGNRLGIFVIHKIHRDSIVLKVGDETFVKNLD